MKLFLCIVVWLFVLVYYPAVAAAVLVLLPVAWLLLLPIRLVAMLVDVTFTVLRAVLTLPARLLAHR